MQNVIVNCGVCPPKGIDFFKRQNDCGASDGHQEHFSYQDKLSRYRSHFNIRCERVVSLSLTAFLPVQCHFVIFTEQQWHWLGDPIQSIRPIKKKGNSTVLSMISYCLTISSLSTPIALLYNRTGKINGNFSSWTHHCTALSCRNALTFQNYTNINAIKFYYQI